MGEIADMMIDGTLCEGCGDFLNAEAPGYPCRCSECAAEVKADRKAANVAAHEQRQAGQKKVSCPHCGRRVKTIGLGNHIRDAHPAISVPHTSTPWRLGRKGTVVADEEISGVGGANDVAYYGGHMVAESITLANAEFIVRACNAHELLVHALQMIRDADDDAASDGLPRIPAIARSAIDAALATAGAA